MQAPKQSNAFIALLLITLTFNAYSMEPEQKKPSKKKKIQQRITNTTRGWATMAGEIMLGNSQPRELLRPENNLHQPFPFTDLPKEVQSLILQLLVQGTNTNNLNTAIETITSLAQVNHELNNLINTSQFCLNIIKHLAQKFNMADQAIALYLKNIPEAKRRYAIQTKLGDLCCDPNVSQHEFQKLYDQDLDLDFSFFDGFSITTPLIAACKCNNLNMIHLLLQKKVSLDLKNLSGDTALIQSIRSNKSLKQIDLLLNAGADPEYPNATGLTPLQAAQETGDQDIINLIQNAIKEKHDKK